MTQVSIVKNPINHVCVNQIFHKIRVSDINVVFGIIYKSKEHIENL